MKLAAILAGLAALSAGAAHSEAVIKKSQGDNQKLIAGPAFSPLVLNVLDEKGVGIGGAEVVFTCNRDPAGPCITLPKSPFKTRSGLGGVAMLPPLDRAELPKAYPPGVETIRVDAAGASATFKVEFTADTAN